MISINNDSANKLRKSFREYIIEYPNDEIRRNIVYNVMSMNRASIDIKSVNDSLVQSIIDLKVNKQEFLRKLSVSEADLPKFKFYKDYIKVDDIIDEYFPQILNAWRK